MASPATATKTKTPKATPAPAKPTPAKLPQNAAKVSGNAARRLAYAAKPANLKTLALLEGGNHEAPAIAKATGVPAAVIEAHLDALRRAKLIGSDKGPGGARTFHITDEGRKLWDAAKLVG